MTEFENLTNLLESLDLDSENKKSTEVKMTEHTNFQLMRLYLDTIPTYDGNPHTLSIFIDNCENFINTFGSKTDQSLNNFLIRAVSGKLTGRALILIGSRLELSSWTDIKNALLLSFGDQRNIDCLIQDLINLRPMKNETPYNFGMRCQDSRSLINSKLNSDSSINAAQKSIYIKSYDDLALKTYIRGLPPHLQLNVRLRDPDNIEKAMSLVIEEENFLYANQRVNSLNTQTSFKPAQRITPAKPNNNMRPPFNGPLNSAYGPYIQPKPHFQPFNSTNFQRPFFQNFNSNPPMSRHPNPFFNSNDRQIRPMHFVQRPPFNKPIQPFANNQNQRFGQHNNVQNKPYKPEPMDTSSIRSRIKPKQNFASEELFTHNVSEIDTSKNTREPQNFEQYYSSDQSDVNHYEQNYYYSDPYNYQNFSEYENNTSFNYDVTPSSNADDYTSDDQNFHMEPSNNNQT